MGSIMLICSDKSLDNKHEWKRCEIRRGVAISLNHIEIASLSLAMTITLRASELLFDDPLRSYVQTKDWTITANGVAARTEGAWQSHWISWRSLRYRSR
jgi:hypothetical protein